MDQSDRIKAIPIDPQHRKAAWALSRDFDVLLDELASERVYRVRELPAPPELPGVYLFADGPLVTHVGRTRNLQARRRDHTGPGNDRAVATYAFRLAREDADAKGVELPQSREEIETHPEFAPFFKAAKARMRTLDFRCVHLSDPPTQAMFEVFASVAFGLPRELWLTH